MSVKTIDSMITSLAASDDIAASSMIDAYYMVEKEKGMLALFKGCLDRLQQESHCIKVMRFSVGLVFAYKKLLPTQEGYKHATQALEDIRRKVGCCDVIYQKVINAQLDQSKPLYEQLLTTETVLEVPKAKNWLQKQDLSLIELVTICKDPLALDRLITKLAKKTQKYAKCHEELNAFTQNDGKKIHKNKTLHGCPYDQNRLGKVAEKIILHADGSLGRENLFQPSFEGFYIAASEIRLSNATYNLMQAPILAHKDKVDTVEDFWNAVVVLRRSPVIVTTHNPEEKLATKGYAERAAYWKQEHFALPLQLKEGWVLTRSGDEMVLATSRHAEHIRIVKRVFVATKSDTGELHTVTQFHYQGWPDHLGAPDHELLLVLHTLVEEEYKRRGLTKQASMTVHCAAGMGRSATFVAVNSLCSELFSKIGKGQKLDQIKLNVGATVLSIKKQRPGMLGSECHWTSIFYALRRMYSFIKGVSNHELRALEHEREQQTIANGKIVETLGSTKYKEIKAQQEAAKSHAKS